ncbi:MAG: transposase [Acetobacteraceae bacterium]|nr:transposase [Acetobacteraceae bacterium]MSP29397.1 transposase [Acetobacteraceae bacterium]
MSDPGVEDALHDSAAMRGFVIIDLGREPAPDETTIYKFCHLIEAHGLGPRRSIDCSGDRCTPS